MKTPPLSPLRSGTTGFFDAENRFVPTGSSMGRPNTLPDLAERRLPCKLRLVRLDWVDGDYDQGGAYWGYSPAHGDIYRAVGDCGEVNAEVFVRAKGRDNAKAAVRTLLPGARFYR